jgi:uncharacterized protein (DUF111 family)
VKCAHGELPFRRPARRDPARPSDDIGGGGGERLTPTGAALLAESWPSSRPGAVRRRAHRLRRAIRDPKEGPPNILRVQLGERRSSGARAAVWLMEVNLDDMGGEGSGFLVQRLREAGALEAWSSAVAMKKDRPAAVVSALCRAEQREALEASRSSIRPPSASAGSCARHRVASAPRYR